MIHPISFVQNEFSLIQRGQEAEMVPGLHESATALICYSPLGRGILAGGAGSVDRRETTDYRRNDLRFGSERLASITDRLAPLWQIAALRAVAPATVALAWLLSKAPAIRVIPGAKTEAQIEASVLAREFTLTDDEIANLDLTGES
jgi:aryl-alcohol dehydrogenase-like predicted oxidoreductase